MLAAGAVGFKLHPRSDAFDLPTKGSDPQAITTFKPTNFCIDTGDVLVFNTVGGWDGVMNMSGPYPMGTPLQIFSNRLRRRLTERVGHPG